MHCVIVKTDGLLLLRDLGSTNGTRVNGQRVRRAALLPNDELTIAGYKFRVQFGASEDKSHPEEYTQQIDAGDVVHMLKKAGPAGEKAPEDPPRALLPNPLPDVYPEEDSKPSRSR